MEPFASTVRNRGPDDIVVDANDDNVDNDDNDGAENRAGAIINEDVDKDPGGDKDYNYDTVKRWRYRFLLWETYLKDIASGSASASGSAIPTRKDFLFSDKHAEDTNPIEHLIWRGQDSLSGLHETLQGLQSELSVLQADDLHQIDDEDELPPDPSAEQEIEDELPPEPGTTLAEQEIEDELPANPSATTLTEQQLNALSESVRLIFLTMQTGLRKTNEKLSKKSQELSKERQERIKTNEKLLKERQERIKTNEKLIKKSQELIKKNEKLIKERQERIKKSENLIKERQERIKERKDNIKKTLELILKEHTIVWYVLAALAEKGNETGVRNKAEPPTGTVNSNRVDKFVEEGMTKLDQMRKAEADKDLCDELLKKDFIIQNKEKLLALQTFVADLRKNCVISSDRKDIQITVNAIIRQERVEGMKYAFPPPKGCETKADQPILGALLFRILAIIRPRSMSLTSERNIAPYSRKTGQGRRIDLVVDDFKEFLHVLYPEMLGRAIEVKPTAHEKKTEFEENQTKAREQVMGHQAKRLLCSFNFGGIGEEDLVHGIVLSMISIQVLEMKVTRIGTNEVDIHFRQTAHVPLLGQESVPSNIHDAVSWDMQSNGVLLLASALVELPKESMFSSERKVTIHDSHAGDYVTIQKLLGSGSFAHVVKLADNMFMKVPRSRRLARSLEREYLILKNLESDQIQGFPKVTPSGVSVVNVHIRNEIAEMTVLRLMGIVGHSLSSYCENKYPEIDQDIPGIIEKVYKALEYAHSKHIFHMDVRPSNIIVERKGEEFDVLLADWGCGMFRDDRIQQRQFIGCAPYAHDSLLGKRENVLQPEAKFDFASLGYTLYHVTRGAIDWHFERPKLVSSEQLVDRSNKMVEFFQNDVGDATARSVPKVHELFLVPLVLVETTSRPKRKRSRTTR